jgi:4'-phosphopantetheinyl transferase superfamily protein
VNVVQLHLASLDDAVHAVRGPEGAGPRQIRRTASAQLARVARVATSDALARSARGSRHRTGHRRPVVHHSISHDRSLLVVACFPAICGVDVEDLGEEDIAEVRDRFCGPADPPGPARALWTAKESAAKATGLGLRAGLRKISFRSSPEVGWAEVTWGGRPTGMLTRTVDLGRRHLSLTVAAQQPPAVLIQSWQPRPGRPWRRLDPGPPSRSPQLLSPEPSGTRGNS